MNVLTLDFELQWQFCAEKWHEFALVDKKHLVQTKNILVALCSKTMNEGLHDGAEDEREKQQRRSLK